MGDYISPGDIIDIERDDVYGWIYGVVYYGLTVETNGLIFIDKDGFYHVLKNWNHIVIRKRSEEL